jgi:hypothetical protein
MNGLGLPATCAAALLTLAGLTAGVPGALLALAVLAALAVSTAAAARWITTREARRLNRAIAAEVDDDLTVLAVLDDGDLEDVLDHWRD